MIQIKRLQPNIMKKIFEGHRINYFNALPVVAKFILAPVVPNIKQMKATFSTQGWSDSKHFSGVAAHEIGHPFEMPEFTEDHLEYFQAVVDLFAIKETDYLNSVPFTLNVIYDMFVNRYIQVECDVDLQHMIEESCKKVKRTQEMMDKEGPLMKALIAFHYVALDYKWNLNLKFDDGIISAAEKALGHIDNKEESKKERFIGVCMALKDLISEEIKDEKESQKQLAEAVKQGKSQGGDSPGLGGGHDQGIGNPSGQDGSTDPIETAKGNGKIGKLVEQYARSKEAEEAGLDASGDEDNNSFGAGCSSREIDSYRNEAKQSIKLLKLPHSKVVEHYKFGEGKGGQLVRSGLWGEGMRDSELDILATLENEGIFIPDETAVRMRPRHKSSEKVEVELELHMIMDTSGSMNIRACCVTLFSFLDYAQKLNGKVTATLFTDRPYFFDDIKKGTAANIRKMERNIYNGFCSGGTNILAALNPLTEYLKKNKRANSDVKKLIVWVSDNCDSQDRINKLQEQLESWGKGGAYVLAVELGEFTNHIDFDKNSVVQARVRNIDSLAKEILMASHKFMGRHL